MKTLAMKPLFMLSAFAFSAGLVSQARAEEQVDLKKVNAVIKNIVQSSIVDGKFIKNASVVVDESKTTLNPQSPRLLATASATVARTVWDKSAESAIQLALDVSAKEVDRSSFDTALAAEVSSQTNVLKLVSYTTASYLDGNPSPSDPDKKKLQEIISPLRNTTSVGQIYDVIVAIIEAAKADPNSDKKQLERLIVTPRTDRAGVVKAIEIKYSEDLVKYADTDFNSFSLDVTVTQSAISLGVGLKSRQEESLEKAVALLKTGLLNIQNEDPATIETLNSQADFLKSLFQGIAGEENVVSSVMKVFGGAEGTSIFPTALLSPFALSSALSSELTK